MLESIEFTLAPGMDRDTAAPQTHLRTTSFGACLLASLFVGWSGHAQALGLGAPQTHSALGQPLMLSFPLSLRAGETLSLDCVFAEVTAGTTKLSPNKVTVRLEGESESSLRAVRVLSSVPIEEPILSVSLSLGCPVRLTRQFSALMDPPAGADMAAASSAAKLVSPRVLSPALRAALATSDAQPKALMEAGLPGELGQERLMASKAVPAASKGAPRPAQAASKQAKSKAALKTERASDPRTAEPQLRLEPFELSPAVAEQAAAAASAAEAAMARLQTVETGLLGLQSDYRGNALKLSALQQTLAAGPGQAPAGETSPLTWGLAALALLLGGAVAFMWRGQSSRQRLDRDSHWWGAEAAQASVSDASAQPQIDAPQPTGPASPAIAAAQLRTASPGVGHDGGAGLAQSAGVEEHTMALTRGVELDYASTDSVMPAELPPLEPEKEMSGLARIAQLMHADLSLEPLSVQLIDPASERGASASAADGPAASGQNLVSVEELIDLEQQVDFFLVLGQDEAALDLLHAQLRTTGDQGKGSALPYLKLMEICQQRGDALAFADIAGRYAVQFDTVPPPWDLDLDSGRGLDAYEDVINGLQSRWSDSGASMSALQKLLSARDGRSASFDLPALRDLLLLYSVARDRSEHEVRGEEIDLFLPLEPDAKTSNPTGFDLMATMVWQGKPGAAAAPVEVDILLDGPGGGP
ncbi:MAG: hypothetical protein IV107_12590 [Paucibacter sp.]|nr:hypothetical protein [Roseateles sp.]